MVVLAIPTEVNGVAYRSRLEARWAIFFERIGLPVEYEREGFQLPAGWYVPDFYAPNIETWIEIKPNHPSEHEQSLCGQLATATGQRVILFHGSPGWWLGFGCGVCDLDGDGMAFSPGPDPTAFGSDGLYMPCRCHDCGRPGIEFEGRSARVCAGRGCGKGEHGGRGIHTADCSSIRSAVDAAKAHQFWNPKRA